MVPDWQTDTVYFSRLLPRRMPKLWAKLESVLKEHKVPIRLLDHTRDIWARDYCPIQAAVGRFVKFRYDPDYLQVEGAENLITSEEVCDQLERLGTIQMTPIILDGGNVVGCTTKAILTEKVFLENKDQPKARIRAELERLLEVEECIFIPIEPGDPFGHADGMVRFIAPRLVVMNNYSRILPFLDTELRRIFKKHRLDVELLPYVPPTVEQAVLDFFAKGIDSAAALGNYVNFLRVGDIIIMPAYGRPEDEMACRAMERICPTAKIVPVEAQELARQGGVFNCISWTVQLGS